MKHLRKILILSAIVFITSCAMYNVPLRENVEIITDDFESTITIKGLNAHFPPGTGLGSHANKRTQYFLRSIVDKETKSTTHQVYVVYKYGEGSWRFYDRASVKGGDSFEVVKIDRDVICNEYGCSYTEQFGIIVPDKYLRNNLEGFIIKASSKSGYDILIKVSDRQIAEQIKAVDSQKSL